MTRSMIEHDLENYKKQDLAIKSCGVNNLNSSSLRNKIVYIFHSVLLVNLAWDWVSSFNLHSHNHR